jgi:uncharacterized membrane protein
VTAVSRRLALAAWAVLVALQVLWYVLYPPVTVPVWAALGMAVLPLLLPLLALPRLERALLWVGIVSLLYFCHGVAEAWSAAQGRWMAWAEIAVALCIVACLGAGSRRRRR